VKKYGVLRKIIAVILVLAMIIGVDSFSVLAEEESVEESFEESVGDVSDSETDETDIVVNEKDDEEKPEEKDLGDEEDVLSAVSMSQSEYDSKMNAFINTPKWANGASWPKNGCVQYSYDWVSYMYGLDGPARGDKYTSISNIKAGDVVRIGGVHTFIVLSRNGNNLYTAEGDFSQKVRVTDSAYRINGSTIYEKVTNTNYSFNHGYHYVDLTSSPADTTPPNIYDVQVYGTSNNAFRVSCKIEEASGHVTVQFPTWTVANQQDDLIWYDAKLSGDTWYCSVKTSDHNYEYGNYCTDIYATDNDGNQKKYTVLYWVSKNEDGSKPVVISFEEPYSDKEKPEIINARIDHVSKEGFTVSCIANDNVGVNSVAFPVWTENNGQDDLIWHQGTYYNGRWSCYISASDHNNEAGKYIIHIYAWDKANNERQFGFSVNLNAEAIGSRMAVGAGQTLPDGDYYIVNGATVAGAGDVSNWFALDIDGTDIPCAADVNVHLWRNVSFTSGVNCDVFTLRYKGDGFYEIKQKNTQMALDVDGGSNAATANIKMWNATGDDPQSWSIEKAPDIEGKGTGFYYLKARCSGFVADAEGLNSLAPSNGVNISQYPIHSVNNINQRWRFIPVSEATMADGNYHIVSAMNNSKGIGIVDKYSNEEIYHNAVIKSNTNNEDGVFSLKYDNNEKCYSIIQRSTGNYLDLEGAGRLAGSSRNIGVWEGNPGEHQHWIIKSAENGYKYIVSRYNGANAMASNDSEGANVYPSWNEFNFTQKWKFLRAVDSVQISDTNITLETGETTMLYATVLPDSAVNKSVKWSSSNANVATVDSYGYITAKSAGTADITVETVDCGKTALCKVTVTSNRSDKDDSPSGGIDEQYDGEVDTAQMEKVTKMSGTTFFVGDSLIIDLTGINPEDLRVKGKAGRYKIVKDSVSGKKVGVITAIKKGTVKLYTLNGKKKRTACVLKAERPKLKSTLKLKRGKVKKLKVSGTKLAPDSWSSSKEEVVSVKSNGTVIANKPGKSYVTATIGTHTFTCVVTVI